jgi:hypothetical protein
VTPRYWKTPAEIHATRRKRWLAGTVLVLLLADYGLQRLGDRVMRRRTDRAIRALRAIREAQL